MTLLDRHASISHFGSFIQACTQETCERWDLKVDRIVCENPPAKWRMHSVTVLHVQSHAWSMECTRYGNAFPPCTHKFTTALACLYSVLPHGWWLYYANDAGSYNTAACKAQNTTLVAPPNCMHEGHAVQCATHMLNVFARQWRSRWCLKLISGISIVFQGPIFSHSATALISESSRMAFQHQYRHQGPSLRLKSKAKLFP